MTLKLIRKRLAELQDKILQIQTQADIALSKKKFISYKRLQNIMDKLKRDFDKIANKLEKLNPKISTKPR
ncbi:MAG: hypothetical protein AABW84_02320 [Nanoarchaeota archaeon]